jgi:hypothetical protein
VGDTPLWSLLIRGPAPNVLLDEVDITITLYLRVRVAET